MSFSRSDHDTPLPPPTELEAAALRWFARCQQGLSAEEETAFQDWLVADPRHAALFNELDGTWSLLGKMAESTPLIAPLPARPSRSARRWRLTAAVAAVAAAVAVAYVGWWRPAYFAGVASTPVGTIQRMQLPDGSVAFLNTDSAVKASFTPGQRRVTLERGEVHFVVAKNPARPFVVEVGGVVVQAVGTAFDVNLHARGIEVLVTEGKVRVNDAADAVAGPRANDGGTMLTAGQRLVIPRIASAVSAPAASRMLPATTVSNDEMMRALAWQQNRLEFESAPLAEIVAQFNRFNRHQLVIVDPALAQQRFGGAFKPQDHAGLVRMLRQNFGLVAEETEHTTLLRAKP